MKIRPLLFALAVAAPLGLGVSAHAAMLTGSLGLNADLTTANASLNPLTPGDVTTTSLFAFSTLLGGANTQTAVSGGTGSFAGIAGGTVIMSSLLDLTTSPYLTLTLAPNSFVASFLVADINVLPNARTIELKGWITGTGFDPTQATFLLQFSQAGGPNTTISYSATLAAVPQTVPEPSTMALAGLGGLGLIGAAWRRRRA